MARTRRRRVLTGIGLLLAVGAILLLALVAGRTTGPSSAPAPGTDADAGRTDGLVDVRTVTFESSFDGTEVTGLAAVPRAVPSRGCVIWEFGFRSTKEDSRYAWQGLAGIGLTTFSIDFRFHGVRSAGPDEYEEVLASGEKFTDMVRGTVADLRSAVSYLEKQPYCKRTVVYVGVSLGGVIGTILSARDDRVDAVALVVTPGTWSGVPTAPTGISSLDPVRYVGEIAPRPLLILSGLTDETVTIENARKLQAAARNPKDVMEFRGGHNPAEGPDAVKNANAILSFLLRDVVEPAYGVDGAAADGTFLSEER